MSSMSQQVGFGNPEHFRNDSPGGEWLSELISGTTVNQQCLSVDTAVSVPQLSSLPAVVPRARMPFEQRLESSRTQLSDDVEEESSGSDSESEEGQSQEAIKVRPKDRSKYRGDYKRCFVLRTSESLTGTPEVERLSEKEEEYLQGRLRSELSYNQVEFSRIVMAIGPNFVSKFKKSRKHLLQYADKEGWNQSRLDVYIYDFRVCLKALRNLKKLKSDTDAELSDIDIKKCWKKGS